MDEHGEVGTVVSVAESSTVTVTVSRSDETMVENVGAEGHEEGSYNEGDGNEIMVEVVGSDVFVDGVSGDGDGVAKEALAGSGMDALPNDNVVEGETGSREAGNFEGPVWEGRSENEEVVRASGERDGVTVAMERVEVVLGSTNEGTSVIGKEVHATVTQKGEEKREDVEKSADGAKNACGGSAQGGVLGDEAWNPGINSMVESSSPMNASEGNQLESFAKQGTVNCKVDEIPGVQDRSVVEMNETISEASTEHGSNHAASRVSDHLSEHVVVVNTEGTSKSPIDVTGENQQMKDNPPGKAAENLGMLDKDSSSLNKLNGSSCEIAVVYPEASSTLQDEVVNNVPANSICRDGGEVSVCTASVSSALVHISSYQSTVHDSRNSSSDSGNHLSSSGEALASEPGVTGPSDDLDVREHEGKVKPGNDLVLDTEPEDAVRETEVVEQEENLASTGKDSGAELESSGGPAADVDVGGHKVDGGSMSDVSGTEPDYVVETQVVKQDKDAIGSSGVSGVVPEACDENKNESTSCSEDIPSMKQEATNTGGDNVHAIPESSHEPSSIAERGEWIGMDIDEVLDFKDEATGLDASAGNLTDSVNAESISGQEIRSTDRDHVSEFCMSDVETKPKDCGVLEGPVQLKSKLSGDGRPVAAGDAEGATDIKGADSNEEVLSRDISLLETEKLDIGKTEVPVDATTASSDEQIDWATPMELVEPQGVPHIPDSNAVDGKASHLAEGNDLEDEKVSVSVGEDAVPGHDPPKDAEAGLLDASVQGVDSYIEANHSIQEQKQDEAPINKVDLNHSKGKCLDDQVPNGAAVKFPVADVKASTGAQSTMVCPDFHGEDNNTSFLPDGVHSMNVTGVNEDKSEIREDQSVETSVPEVATSGEANQVTEIEDEFCTTDGHDSLETTMLEAMSVEDRSVVGVTDHSDHGRLVNNGEQGIASEEHASETDQSKILEKEMLKPLNSSRICQSGYLPQPENDGDFSAADLVWGKVRSHPWWPGQIFDPSDASDKAVKYYKKDSFLVAYFGDRTFAWNDASVLKPFRLHFCQIEKQSNSEAFQNAVSSALDEVSRRVELGLFCSCIPRDSCERIECQVVENTGIREESSRRYGVDKSSAATSFEPDKLLQHIRLLAQSPLSMIDRLELVIASAQLSAFCRFKGYRAPSTFMSDKESLENTAGTSGLSEEPAHTLPVTVDDEPVPLETSSSLKRKLSLKDNLQPKKKERSLLELMGDAAYSPDEEEDLDGKALGKSVSTSGKKRKAVDPVNDGSDRRISIYAAKVSTTSSSPRPSFKVGECIRRIASQLTGSASILKGNDQQSSDASLHVNESSHIGNMVFPTDISLEEMLSQLQLAARDPKKGYSFLNNIILFFSVFRNSVVTKHAAGRSGGGRKRKASNAAGGSTEEFEFDDVNDSYWTDRIVHNYPEEQLLQNGENGDGDYSLVVSDQDKLHKPSRRPYSRKQYSNGNYENSAEEVAEDIERRKLSPAELVLTFAEGDTLPSEINLNKMFRRFGPLKESDTEVDQDSHRARVVFKRGSDAEVAHSSAATFKIFGPKLVSYQLSYSPSTQFRVLPLLITQVQDDAP